MRVNQYIKYNSYDEFVEKHWHNIGREWILGLSANKDFENLTEVRDPRRMEPNKIYEDVTNDEFIIILETGEVLAFHFFWEAEIYDTGLHQYKEEIMSYMELGTSWESVFQIWSLD